MDAVDLQQALFKQVKECLPPHLSLPEELASLLGISADSAYRRIRGEKPLDIGELGMISKHFSISLDALLGQQNGNFVFQGRFVGQGDFTLANWLTSLNLQLEQVAEGREKAEFIFQAKDIPLFHHFQVPELAQFKLSFWRRTILQDAGAQVGRFDLAERDTDLLALGRKTFLTYMRMPSTEIWNAESLNGTMRQIAFYRDAGVFARESDAQLLFDKLTELLDHLQQQAEAGVKFALGETPAQGTAAFRVFVNEVMIGDNLIYSDNGRTPVVFVNHGVINYIATTDKTFTMATHRSLQNIMRRSMLISGTGEKERNRFFRSMREEVERHRH